MQAALDFLTGLPGVGRKTAAVVMLFTFGRPEIPVDTHVYRVGGRLGLFRPRASFEEAHDEMLAITPPEDAYELHINLIRHGRAICRPRPRCGECALRRMCPWYRRAQGRTRGAICSRASEAEHVRHVRDRRPAPGRRRSRLGPDQGGLGGCVRRERPQQPAGGQGPLRDELRRLPHPRRGGHGRGHRARTWTTCLPRRAPAPPIRRRSSRGSWPRSTTASAGACPRAWSRASRQTRSRPSSPRSPARVRSSDGSATSPATRREIR